MSDQKSGFAVKRWALILLIINLAVFVGVIVAQKNGYHHPVLGYVKAFAEAACVGALADWFAVVALFRHPLGIPLPHTAVLPAKQAQLAQGVAKFIGTHFLDPQVISDQLVRLQMGERLNSYAQTHLTTEVIAKRVPQLLQALMQRVPDHAPDRLIEWSQQALSDYLTGPRIGRVLSRVVGTAQEQHLDRALVKTLALSIHRFVTAEDAKERVKPWVEELIIESQKAKIVDASWWAKMKNQLTGQAIEWVDDWIIEKTLAWLADLTQKIQDDDQHAVHLYLEHRIHEWRARMMSDQGWHDWFTTHVHEWLRTPAAEALVQRLWVKSRAWLETAAASDSPYIIPIAEKIKDIVLGYLADPIQQQKLTAKTAQLAATGLADYQMDIRDWLTAQMNAWSKERLNNALENAIGNDLQFIRINGTLIGGLMGILLYIINQLIGA